MKFVGFDRKAFMMYLRICCYSLLGMLSGSLTLDVCCMS